MWFTRRRGQATLTAEDALEIARPKIREAFAAGVALGLEKAARVALVCADDPRSSVMTAPDMARMLAELMEIEKSSAKGDGPE